MIYKGFLIGFQNPAKIRDKSLRKWNEAIYQGATLESVINLDINHFKNQRLSFRVENLFHQFPLLSRRCLWVAALELCHVSLPFGLARQGAEVCHVAFPVEVVNGIDNHEELATVAVDFHREDADLMLAFDDFGPHMAVHFNVFLNHGLVVNEGEGLAISFHRSARIGLCKKSS